MTFAPALLAVHLLLGPNAPPRKLVVDPDRDDYKGLPAYLRYSEPEPLGRPDRTASLRPDAPAKIYLQWRAWIRLDAAAQKAGWRMAVDTWNGVLWPLRAVTRTFFSRCVGTTWIEMEPLEDDLPFTADPLASPRRIQVEVALRPPFFVAGVPPYFSPEDVGRCRPIDPPARRIHGELNGRHMGDEIVLWVGDRFVLVPPEKCRDTWNDVRLEGDPSIVRIGADPRGPRFEAVQTGLTEFSVPLRSDCSPGRDLPYLGDREKVLLKVGARSPNEDPESDEFNGQQQTQEYVNEDPPELARAAVAVRPGMRTVRLGIGDLVRLDSAAFDDRWRIGARTSDGILWPREGAPRVYRARCPGKSFLRIEHVDEDYPIGVLSSAPTYAPPENIEVEVVAGDAGIPPECGRTFDPPRQKSNGELSWHNIERGIVLSAGERFTLVPSPRCEEAWKDFKIEDPTIVKRLPDDPRGFQFQALRRGKSEMSAPGMCPNDDPHWSEYRVRWLLIVE